MSTYKHQSMDNDFVHNVKTEVEEEVLFSNPPEMEPLCSEDQACSDLPTLKVEPLSAEQGEFYEEIYVKEEPLVLEEGEEAAQFVLEKEEVKVSEVNQEITTKCPGKNDTAFAVPCDTNIEKTEYCSLCNEDPCNIEKHCLQMQFKITSGYCVVRKGLIFEVTYDKCHICKKSFTTTIDICHHMEDSSSSLKSGQCNICMKKYEKMSLPWSCEHERVTQYVDLNAMFEIERTECPFCLKNFTTPTKLRIHIQTTHFRDGGKLYLQNKKNMCSLVNIRKQVNPNQELTIIHKVNTDPQVNEELFHEHCTVFLESQRIYLGQNETVDNQVRPCDSNLKSDEYCIVCKKEWSAVAKKWLEMKYKETNAYFYVTGGVTFEIIDNKCSICKKQFDSPIDTCQHIKQIHLMKNTVSKLEIKESINELMNLDSHWSLVHENIRKFIYQNILFEIEGSKCPLCSDILNDSGQVVRHIPRQHFQERRMGGKNGSLMPVIPKKLNQKKTLQTSCLNTELEYVDVKQLQYIENINDPNTVSYAAFPQTATRVYEQQVITTSTITSEILSQNQQSSNSVSSRKNLSTQNFTKATEIGMVRKIASVEAPCVPQILRKRSRKQVLEYRNKTADKTDVATNSALSNDNYENIDDNTNDSRTLLVINHDIDVQNDGNIVLRTDHTIDVQNDVNMINFSTNSQIFKHICHKCSQTFSYYYQLVNHISWQHSKLWNVQICYCCNINSCWMQYLIKYLYSLKCKEAIHDCGDDYFSVIKCKNLKDYFHKFGFLCGNLKLNDKIYCKICSVTFIYKNDLLVHLNTHIQKKRITCKKCLRNFTGCYFYENLVAIISTENEYVGVVCLLCDQSYKSEYLLEEHRKIKHAAHIHPNDKMPKLKLEPVKHEYYKCDMCTVSFLSKKGLKIHMKLCHIKFLKGCKYSCKYCSFTCMTPRQRSKHVMRNHASLATDTICKICKTCYSTVKYLRDHEGRPFHKLKMERIKRSQYSKTAETNIKESTNNISCVTSDFLDSMQHRDKLKLVKACSVLLDRSEVSRYLCPETGLHKYSPGVEGGPQENKRPRSKGVQTDDAQLMKIEDSSTNSDAEDSPHFYQCHFLSALEEG